MKPALLISLLTAFLCLGAAGQPAWRADLDSRIRFYQMTDFGIILAGTEKSLYAVDGRTGERVWRRETGRINETAVTPVPGTDLILFTATWEISLDCRQWMFCQARKFGRAIK